MAWEITRLLFSHVISFAVWLLLQSGHVINFVMVAAIIFQCCVVSSQTLLSSAAGGSVIHIVKQQLYMHVYTTHITKVLG